MKARSLIFIDYSKFIEFLVLIKMASNRYIVIEFDDGVMLAAEKWLTPKKTRCYWPPYKNKSRTLRVIENQEDVAENWSLYEVKKIFASTSMFNQILIFFIILY